ncbi:MAG: hypothetical protein ACHQ3O_13510 [Candidatus Limnocylindria bacterium]|jgi:hypothetical protein
MRHPSQAKLRGLCLLWLAFGAFACGEDPAPPAEPPIPLWAQDICEKWRHRDGSCDQRALIADYEECMRTDGRAELDRLRNAGVRSRMRLAAQERATMLCLERRAWVMTAEGRARRSAKPNQPAPTP